ncbi:MAG: hypothetical protein NT157_02420 [Candidatus Micrarchaeota archaeon]|nr:hypothetical protein [Candidatus Micrarchaeota archaeon]
MEKTKKVQVAARQTRKMTSSDLVNTPELGLWCSMAKTSGGAFSTSNNNPDFKFLIATLISPKQTAVRIGIGPLSYLKDGSGEAYISVSKYNNPVLYRVEAKEGAISNVRKMPAYCEPLALARLERGDKLSHDEERAVLTYYGKVFSMNSGNPFMKKGEAWAMIVASPNFMKDGRFANVQPTKAEGENVKFEIVVPFDGGAQTRGAAQPKKGVYRLSVGGDKPSAVQLPITMDDKEVSAAMEAYAKIFRGEGLKPEEKPKLESKEMLAFLRNYLLYLSEKYKTEGYPKPEGFDKLYSLVMSETPRVEGKINVSKEGRLKLDLTVKGTYGMSIVMDAIKGEMLIKPL